MSQPIVFISHFRVKQGELDGLRRLVRDVSGSIEMEKPRTLVYLSYIDEDADNVTFVHVFADSESMDVHFEGADERSRAAFEFLEPDGWEESTARPATPPWRSCDRPRRPPGST